MIKTYISKDIFLLRSHSNCVALKKNYKKESILKLGFLHNNKTTLKHLTINILLINYYILLIIMIEYKEVYWFNFINLTKI